MPGLLDRHPWLPFVLAFLLLIAAWGVLIVLALRHQPAEIPLEPPARSN